MLDILSLGLALVALVSWLIITNALTGNDALKDIPELRFEDNDTQERYITDSRALLRKGYDKYLRHGTPFKMRNPIGELGPQVLLPMKYLSEVKDVAPSKLSFVLFSEKIFLLKYSNSPVQTDASSYVARVHLTRSLGPLAPHLYQEAIAGLDLRIKSSQGQWSAYSAYDILSNVTAQVSSMALVGGELCRSEEWIQIALGTVAVVFGACFSIRNEFSPRWRWLAKWQSKAPKQVAELRAKATNLLLPVYQKRVEEVNRGSTPASPDCVSGLLRVKGADKTLQAIVEQELFLQIAAIHTTSSSLTSILYDLLAHPEDMSNIVDEMNKILAQCGGNWTTQEIAKMELLDSFMKESQRVHPMGFITAQRIGTRDYTFKDGLCIPAGTVIQFPADAVHHDSEIYPDPETFDSMRFLRLRQTVDAHKFHFATVSDTSLGFGAGSHACPGRWLASVQIKVILVALLTRYDIMFGDVDSDGSRPPDVFQDFNMIPNRAASIAFRKK